MPGSDYINANFLDVSKLSVLPLLFYIAVYAIGI